VVAGVVGTGTQAGLDRRLHFATLINIKGDFYRMRE